MLKLANWGTRSVLALGAIMLAAPAARAAVPATYKGTPYLGTPQAIPGRVELANMDMGGQGVAWAADHNRMNSAGYEPISGNDYRPDDKNLPNICKTNKQNPDSMVGTGAVYPSTSPAKEVYYMGYAHAHDWVRMTVDVKQAGKYNVSSTWASANGQWGLSLWFNDGSNAAAPMDGVNKSGKVVMPGTSDYHKWKDYPNFTQVDLTAGLQIFTFHLEQEDHLQYGFLQFDLVGGAADGGVPATDAGGTAGTAGTTTGTAGAGSGAAGAGAAGTAGTTTGTAGTAGTTTGEAGSGGTTAGTAGTGASTAGTANTGGSTSGTAGTGTSGGGAGTGAPRGKASGGCSYGGRGAGSLGAALALLGCALVARRRSRTR